MRASGQLVISKVMAAAKAVLCLKAGVLTPDGVIILNR